MKLSYYKLQFDFRIDMTDVRAGSMPLLTLMVGECEEGNVAVFSEIPWAIEGELPGGDFAKAIIEDCQELVLYQIKRILKKDPTTPTELLIAGLDRKHNGSLYISKMEGPKAVHVESMKETVVELLRVGETMALGAIIEAVKKKPGLPAQGKIQHRSKSTWTPVHQGQPSMLPHSAFSLIPSISPMPLPGGFAGTSS